MFVSTSLRCKNYAKRPARAGQYKKNPLKSLPGCPSRGILGFPAKDQLATTLQRRRKRCLVSW